MANTDSYVAIHMAASLDGFIARKNGSVECIKRLDQIFNYTKGHFESARMSARKMESCYR